MSHELPAVLFLCVHNAGRSQMAAAFARVLGSGRVEVYPGGSEPADRMNLAVVRVMAEVGIDISGAHPRRWTDGDLRADVVVTRCGDDCPFVPGKRYLDWELEDPAVRPIRDEIERRVRGLLEELLLDADRPVAHDPRVRNR